MCVVVGLGHCIVVVHVVELAPVPVAPVALLVPVLAGVLAPGASVAQLAPAPPVVRAAVPLLCEVLEVLVLGEVVPVAAAVVVALVDTAQPLV